MINPLSGAIQSYQNTVALRPGVATESKPPVEEIQGRPPGETRPAGTETAETQGTETRNNGRTEEIELRSAAYGADGGGVDPSSASRARGEQFDVTV